MKLRVRAVNAEELGQLLKERPERLNDVESFAEFIHEAYPNERETPTL